jgi:hypothetical protein
MIIDQSKEGFERKPTELHAFASFSTDSVFKTSFWVRPAILNGFVHVFLQYLQTSALLVLQFTR